MKSVQGDSGHAQLKMVADVYSHILDDDRMLNAQRMENAFYSGKAENDPSAEHDPKAKESDAEAMVRLLQKPEMATLLKTLAANL